MFSNAFNPQNGFWNGIGRVGDLFGLSVCWLVCSLPLVTLGAATTALYDAVFHGVRKGEDVVYRRFFRTFRDNWKTATLSTLLALLMAAVCAILWSVTFTVANAGRPEAGLLLSAYQVLFCLPLSIWLLAQALLSRFTFGLSGLLSTAFRLTLGQLPRAVVAGLLAMVCADFCLRNFLFIFVLPGLWALGASLFYEKIFAPYLPQEEPDDPPLP